MDLAEVFLFVRESLNLEDTHLEAVLRPPPVLGGAEGAAEAGDPLVSLP